MKSMDKKEEVSITDTLVILTSIEKGDTVELADKAIADAWS